MLKCRRTTFFLINKVIFLQIQKKNKATNLIISYVFEKGTMSLLNSFSNRPVVDIIPSSDLDKVLQLLFYRLTEFLDTLTYHSAELRVVLVNVPKHVTLNTFKQFSVINHQLKIKKDKLRGQFWYMT